MHAAYHNHHLHLLIHVLDRLVIDGRGGVCLSILAGVWGNVGCARRPSSESRYYPSPSCYHRYKIQVKTYPRIGAISFQFMDVNQHGPIFVGSAVRAQGFVKQQDNDSAFIKKELQVLITCGW